MRFRSGVFLLLLSLFTAGCVEMVAVGAGAGVVWSLSADSVSSEFDLTKVRAVEIAVGTIKDMKGTVTHTSIRNGVVRGIVNDSTVLITALERRKNGKSTGTIRVSVTARMAAGTLPDRKTATRIFVQFTREAE